MLCTAKSLQICLVIKNSYSVPLAVGRELINLKMQIFGKIAVLRLHPAHI